MRKKYQNFKITLAIIDFVKEHPQRINNVTSIFFFTISKLFEKFQKCEEFTIQSIVYEKHVFK